VFIDILIPTYNRCFLLENVVENVLKQTYQYINIIIADNNSTDNTEKIGKNLSKIYNNIFYFKNPENLGVYGNYDYSLQNYCKSDYVLILSDDDFFIDYDYIKEAVKYIKKYDLAWIGAGYNIININTNSMKSFKRKEFFLGNGLEFLKEHKFGLDNFSWFSVVFNRKEAVKYKFNIYNLYNADYLPIFSMNFNKKRMILNKIVGVYTINSFQANNKTDIDFIMNGYKLYYFIKKYTNYDENIFIINVKNYICAAFKNAMDKAVFNNLKFEDERWFNFFKELENNKFYPFFDEITDDRYSLFKKDKQEFKQKRIKEIRKSMNVVIDDKIKKYIGSFNEKN